MSLDILFPHLRDFRLLSYSRETRRLVLTCERVTPSEPCPLCGTAAHRIHSRDARTIWDLSVQNVQVLLVNALPSEQLLPSNMGNCPQS